MHDHAAAQSHLLIARSHRTSANQADLALARARRQDVADVVEERRHSAMHGDDRT
jgi:hypothetical protein